MDRSNFIPFPQFSNQILGRTLFYCFSRRAKDRPRRSQKRQKSGGKKERKKREKRGKGPRGEFCSSLVLVSWPSGAHLTPQSTGALARLVGQFRAFVRRSIGRASNVKVELGVKFVERRRGRRRRRRRRRAPLCQIQTQFAGHSKLISSLPLFSFPSPESSALQPVLRS